MTSPILITLNQIRDKDPCCEGWERIFRAKGHLSFDEPWPLADALETNGFYDTLWALQCLPQHDALWQKYAVWCARQVGHLMVDARTRRALEVAWRYSEGQVSESELSTARSDAKTTWAAASASWITGSDETPRAWAAVAAAAAAEVAVGVAAVAAAEAAVAAAEAAVAAAEAAVAAAEAAVEGGTDDAIGAQREKLAQILNAGRWVED